MERTPEPISLQEAIEYFSNPDNCREYVVARRWPNGVECPTCGCTDVIFLANQNRWQCRNKHSKRQFSLKTGTIYEDSPLGLDKWLVATWLVSNCKNGVSSCEVGRALHITQKTTWFMDHRIRFSLGMGPGNKLSGQVEADETFIGGKARNMRADKRAEKITGTGGKDKTAVMGFLSCSRSDHSRRSPHAFAAAPPSRRTSRSGIPATETCCRYGSCHRPANGRPGASHPSARPAFCKRDRRSCRPGESSSRR